MIDNECKNLIYIPKNANYIEILGHRIDGFDSFEAFCEHLKKYAELEEMISHLQAEIGELTAFANQLHEQRDMWMEKCDDIQTENERLIEEVAKVRRKALLEAFSKFAGHSDYHGDTILCKLKCMAEGKEVGNAKPLDTSKIKAEAYKEFAYELMQIPDVKVYKHEIKNLLKEKIGENNAK